MPTFLRVVREGEPEHALARELRETREATNATKPARTGRSRA